MSREIESREPARRPRTLGASVTEVPNQGDDGRRRGRVISEEFDESGYIASIEVDGVEWQTGTGVQHPALAHQSTDPKGFDVILQVFDYKVKKLDAEYLVEWIHE